MTESKSTVRMERSRRSLMGLGPRIGQSDHETTDPDKNQTSTDTILPFKSRQQVAARSFIRRPSIRNISITRSTPSGKPSTERPPVSLPNGGSESIISSSTTTQSQHSRVASTLSEAPSIGSQSNCSTVAIAEAEAMSAVLRGQLDEVRSQLESAKSSAMIARGELTLRSEQTTQLITERDLAKSEADNLKRCMSALQIQTDAALEEVRIEADARISDAEKRLTNAQQMADIAVTDARQAEKDSRDRITDLMKQVMDANEKVSHVEKTCIRLKEQVGEAYAELEQVKKPRRLLAFTRSIAYLSVGAVVAVISRRSKD